MMSTPDAPFGWRRGWVIGLALLSLVVPVAAVFVRSEPLVPFADPARLSYYRQMVVALIVGWPVPSAPSPAHAPCPLPDHAGWLWLW